MERVNSFSTFVEKVPKADEGLMLEQQLANGLILGSVYALLHVLPNYAALARPYLWMLACLVWAARSGARVRESAAA